MRLLQQDGYSFAMLQQYRGVRNATEISSLLEFRRNVFFVARIILEDVATAILQEC